MASEFERKASEAAASITAKTRAPSAPPIEEPRPLTKAELHSIARKTALGLLIAAGLTVVGYLIVTDPRGKYSPRHLSMSKLKARKQRDAEGSSPS